MGQAFQPEQLDLISKAFDQAWAALTSHPTHIRHDPEVMKADLRDKLLALVSAGMKDSELIQKAAVHAMLNGKSSNNENRKPA